MQGSRALLGTAIYIGVVRSNTAATCSLPLYAATCNGVVPLLSFALRRPRYSLVKPPPHPGSQELDGGADSLLCVRYSHSSQNPQTCMSVHLLFISPERSDICFCNPGLTTWSTTEPLKAYAQYTPISGNDSDRERGDRIPGLRMIASSGISSESAEMQRAISAAAGRSRYFGSR